MTSTTLATGDTAILTSVHGSFVQCGLQAQRALHSECPQSLVSKIQHPSGSKHHQNSEIEY